MSDKRMHIKKFENNNSIDYSREDFLRECKLYDKDGQELWDKFRKEIFKKPEKKRYKIFKHNKSTYIFYNGFTDSEIKDIIFPKSDEYVLKHKNKNVLRFTFIDGNIKIIEIINKEHLPYPLIYKCDEYLFDNWFNDRLIPATRYQYNRFRNALELFSKKDRIDIIIDNKALSLSDCYWVNKVGDKSSWETVNYFNNKFNIDLLDFYLSSPNRYMIGNRLPVIINPAMGLTGYLPKAWTIKNDKRVLLKRGLERNAQVLNEICVSNISKEAGIDTVIYTKDNYKDFVCSACDCFCSNELELVSAMDLTQNISDNEPLEKQLDNYERLLKKDIPNIRTYIDQMLIIDYITANEDRHWSNFGVLRNPDTLKIIKPAPLFDFGNSLWYDFLEDCIGNENRNKIFEGITASETLQYIKNFNCLDYTKLERALQIIKSLYTNPYTSEAIYKGCINRLNEIRKRIK